MPTHDRVVGAEPELFADAHRFNSVSAESLTSAPYGMSSSQARRAERPGALEEVLARRRDRGGACKAPASEPPERAGPLARRRRPSRAG